MTNSGFENQSIDEENIEANLCTVFPSPSNYNHRTKISFNSSDILVVVQFQFC